MSEGTAPATERREGMDNEPSTTSSNVAILILPSHV